MCIRDRIDAERIAALGIPSVQLNTDGACHIEAMKMCIRDRYGLCSPFLFGKTEKAENRRRLCSRGRLQERLSEKGGNGLKKLVCAVWFLFPGAAREGGKVEIYFFHDTACASCNGEEEFNRIVEAVSYTHLDVYKRQLFGCSESYIDPASGHIRRQGASHGHRRIVSGV